jgi:hypothetical protein
MELQRESRIFTPLYGVPQKCNVVQLLFLTYINYYYTTSNYILEL